MAGTAEGIRKARETLARIRAERTARARLLREDGPKTFSEAFDTVFADWFAGPTWRPWRTVGKAIFGERLNDAEVEEFKQFTGRTIAPTSPAREVWLVVGRRAGYDHLCLRLQRGCGVRGWGVDVDYALPGQGNYRRSSRSGAPVFEKKEDASSAASTTPLF